MWRIKKHFLPVQYGPDTLDTMRAAKRWLGSTPRAGLPAFSRQCVTICSSPDAHLRPLAHIIVLMSRRRLVFLCASAFESTRILMNSTSSAHPDGMVVGEIQSELAISASNLSHHLDKLKNEDLVQVSRAGTFLRYTANTSALEELLSFLYAECCTRNKAIKPENIIQLCK